MTHRSALVVLVLLGVAGCGSGNAGGRSGGPRPFPVQTEVLKGETVEYVVRANNGSVETLQEVLITARVAGAIEAIHFLQGTEVTPDTVLVEIEPQRFALQLDAAKAAHDRAKAELKDAQDGLNRRETPGSAIFSKEEVELWRTKVAVAQATAAERKAAFDQAQLDAANALVKSPVAGEIEERLVTLGQWVEPGAVIARVVKRDELYLNFAVPEDEAVQLKKGMPAEFTIGGEGPTYRAKVIHVSASADRTTRMVQITAEIDKQDLPHLMPGTFAIVTLPVGSRADAPTVPETAVRPSDQGFLVYVLSEDKSTAHATVIEIGLRTADGRIEVRSGLKPGDEIVIRGAESLRDGVAVVQGATPTGGAQP